VVAELVTRLNTARSLEERLQLQREIATAKSDAALAVMDIQIDYAARGGFTELAERLEAEKQEFEARRDAPRTAVRTDSVRDRQVDGGASR